MEGALLTGSGAGEKVRKSGDRTGNLLRLFRRKCVEQELWKGLVEERKTIGRETAGTSSVCSRESNGRSELLSAFHSAFTRSKPPALFWRFLKHSGGRSFIAVQFFSVFLEVLGSF